MVQVHSRFTRRHEPGGFSAPPYDGLNLAEHVGDDPTAVARNRDALGLPVAELVWMDQVHGNRVAVVESAPSSPVPATDALVTATEGLGLAVLVADCVPVVLADPIAGVVAVAHAGRRGMYGGVVPATLDAMAGLGARPERTVARLGPAVCGACYEVPAELAQEVCALVPSSGAVSRWGTPAIDIRAGLAAALRDRGVTDVRVSSVCTMEDGDYFSYRRDGRTGRFAGLTWLTE